MPSANRPRITGLGRVLVAVYGVLALAATGRSLVQIVERFDTAPLAFTLSAVSAVVYILATLALVFSASRGWYVVAWAAIVFELAGVLIVGSYSLFRHDLFPEETVWSWFGSGYVFVPLVLPFVGISWLLSHRPGADPVAPAPAPVERSVW
ncbi:hypothetical protein [Microbacterium sp. 18062]|uniref:hypothetical protein n=1 Tax=Microbacterium sp. 18062 TaxID=2681410 RepID=UPI00135898A5|nr:hypothetical protein [Microbacterium sp. 18062]